jgi:hypothetical protein
MTAPSARTYPVACTNKAWQKRKSFKDKLMSKTKTGLGEELKKAEKAWKAIKFAHLDARRLKAKTLATAQKNLLKARVAEAHVLAAKATLTVAKDKAIATARNEALSDKARTAAGNIANGLDSALSRLDTVNLTDFDKEIARLSKK